MNIIMMGAQGTGKGTVAGILSEKTGWPQISTGDIFRKNLEEKTELGIEAGKYMNAGNLVPDEITVPMVANRLNEEDAREGFILDGFPRTIAQAEKLDEILKNISGNKTYFDISEFIILISTFDLKSNCNICPLLKVINNSLSISKNPAVSIP